jgi:hypothetical protein
MRITFVSPAASMAGGFKVIVIYAQRLMRMGHKICIVLPPLRRKHPTVFAAHPLSYLWGFKYDNQLSGIELHADFAVINAHFWITPDDANLDPKSGGLVIWDHPATLDWDYNKYNSDSAAARKFLAHAGARSVTVP